MAKKAPEHHDVLDDSSLDEYGVWVKAGPEDPVGFADDSISELLDDSPVTELGESKKGADLPSFDEELDILEPKPGSSPAAVMNQKEQEVPDMSENDKDNAASPSDNLDIDQEISLDTSEELAIGGDDDLGGLSDLLLNIDEEQDSEDTIYLEDDDLSLDLDESEDLGLDSEMMLGGEDDGYGEDISIPGIDDLNIDSDDTGIDGFEDALAKLDEEELDIPEDSPVSSPAPRPAPNLEMHDIEEVGLDEFLQEESLDEISTEILADEEMAPEPAAEPKTAPADLDETMDEIIIDDTSLDLDEELTLEPESSVPETGMDEPLDAGDFDDVAAFTDDLMTEPESPVEAAPVEKPRQGEAPAATVAVPVAAESTTVLKSIEEELHAIRSELTDLRSELKKLRDKGVSRDDGERLATVVDQTEDLVESLHEQAVQETPVEIEENEKPAGGGFFDDDEDETIALTGDELDNILNSAEFTEEVGESTNPDLDDLDIEEPVIGGTSIIEAGSDETELVDAQVEEEPGFEDLAEDKDFPPIEEINLQEIDAELTIGDESLEEGDVTDLTIGNDDIQDDAVVAAEVVDDPFGGSEQAVEQMAAMDIDNVLAGIEELKDNEEDIELFTGDELDSMELEIGSVVAEPVPQPVSTAPEAADHSENLSSGLKQEIKAVLAYMDQLLESLPEEKIEEFARSEHFEVYKKLFTELGL